MRPGGESGKFGNDYEESWTIHNLLQVVDDRALNLELEPIRDGLGVEFIKTRVDGVREFHSAKVQTSGPYWSVADLMRQSPKTGRSIVGDLFSKMSADSKAEACFVSAVGANPLHLICEDARLAGNELDFQQRMSAERDSDFRSHIQPLFPNIATAKHHLSRLRAIAFNKEDLNNLVERDIRLLLRRSDHQQLVPADVRRFLGEVVLGSMGRKLAKADLLAKLQKEGYELADLARNPSVLNRIQERNKTYKVGATRFLINGSMIRRQEAQDAFVQLQSGSVRYGAFVGTAGMGKSCAIAELCDYLESGRVPFLVLRLDQPIKASTPRHYGLDLDLPESPVHVLAGVAAGSPCVLILDQLDALSIVSGRSTEHWSLIDAMLLEVAGHRRMSVWLGCRGFDLDNDPTIMRMMQANAVRRLELKPLDVQEVKRQIRLAGYDATRLTPAQLEVLQTPMHLSIYIEGVPDAEKPFQTVIDLYDRYWTTKQDHIKAAHGVVQWTPVIDLVCDELTQIQSLNAPVAKIQDSQYWDDVRKMASANVLLIDGKVCRFFHEGFFDYAFARRFAHRGQTLADFLVNSGEQDLFRRAQVRQVLTYLRARDRARYLKELDAILKTAGIRAHILDLVYRWLGDLPDPTPEELTLLPI